MVYEEIRVLNLKKYKQAFLLASVFITHILLLWAFLFTQNKIPTTKTSTTTDLSIVFIPSLLPKQVLLPTAKIKTRQIAKQSPTSKSIPISKSIDMTRQVENQKNPKAITLSFDQLQLELKAELPHGKINIDIPTLTKGLENPSTRTLQFPKKIEETQIEKLRAGYARAAPYEEHPVTTYENPDGSRMTKKNSNKGSICYRTQRATENVDFKNPRLREVKC